MIKKKNTNSMAHYLHKCKHFFCCLLLLLFSSSILALENRQMSPRSSHIDEASGIELKRISSNTYNQELNTSIELVVELLQHNEPLVNANVSWFIDQTLASSNTQQGAYFVSNGATNLVEFTTQTDSNGQARVSVFIGNVISQFQIRAQASELLSGSFVSQEFQITAGVGAAINVGTPEQEIASTLDALCPLLQSNESSISTEQQALLNRCKELQTAIVQGQTLEAANALREISPEEVAIQSAVSSSFSGQQMSNIASRLSAVRKGSQSISLSMFSLRIKDYQLPSYLVKDFVKNVFAVNENESDVSSLLSNKVGIFLNGNVSIGTRNTSNNEDGFAFDSYGLTIGGDYRIKRNSFLGIAFGLSKSKVDISNNGGDLTANGKNIAVYASHYLNQQTYFDGVVSFGHNQYEMNRNIKFVLAGNPTDRTASSNTQGKLTAVSLGGGYELNDDALLMTFFARMNYSSSQIDRFTESGAEELNLIIEKQKMDNLNSSFGAQASYTHSTRWAVLIPFLSFSWEHEFKSEANQINGSFADSNLTSNFTVNTEKLDSNYFTSAQGISLVLPRGISAFFRFETLLGREFYTVNNFSFGGRWELNF